MQSGLRSALAEQYVEDNRAGAGTIELVDQYRMQAAWPARRDGRKAFVVVRAGADPKVDAAMIFLRVARQKDIAACALAHCHQHCTFRRLERTAQLEQPSQPRLLLQIPDLRNPKQGAAK